MYNAPVMSGASVNVEVEEAKSSEPMDLEIAEPSDLETDEVETDLSALQDNIRRKGNNSYYYAHTLKVDGPRWDGNEQPRLLKVDVAPVPVNVRARAEFSSYAWSDGKKSVKVYIDLPAEIRLSDEEITLENTENSFSLTARASDKDYVLNILNLYEEISSSSFRRKESNRIVVTLTKVSAMSWYQLTKSKS